MVDLFECNESTSIFQVDETNIFDSLNGNVFVHSIKVICPAIAKFASSCYPLPSRLFDEGGSKLSHRKEQHKSILLKWECMFSE